MPVERLHEQLRESLQVLVTSEDWRQALAVAARFHDYSFFRNPGNDHRLVSTGVIVGDAGHIVTALHVVDAAMEILADKEKPKLKVAFPGPHDEAPGMMTYGTFSAQSAAIIDTDRKSDLALLQISSQDTGSLSHQVGPNQVPAVAIPISVVLGRPEVGEPVASSGYPLGEPMLVTTTGTIANVVASDPYTHQDRYLVDMTANPGNSGGPVYRVSDCGLVGILVSGKVAEKDGNKYAAGLAYAVPAKILSTMLEGHSIAFRSV